MIKAMTSAIGGVLTFCILLVVIIGVGVGVTVFGYWLNAELSKPAGKSQVTQDTNNGTNQETASGIFNQLTNQISGDQAKIKEYAASGETSAAQLTNADCIAAVQQYNSDAGTVTMTPWIPAGDPTSMSVDVCDVPN